VFQGRRLGYCFSTGFLGVGYYVDHTAAHMHAVSVGCDYLRYAQSAGGLVGYVFTTGVHGIGYYFYAGRRQCFSAVMTGCFVRTESSAVFFPADAFAGYCAGYVFKSGVLGLGYYWDRVTSSSVEQHEGPLVPFYAALGDLPGFVFGVGTHGLGYYGPEQQGAVSRAESRARCHTLPHAAIRCYALPHAATRCHTLPHAATRCHHATHCPATPQQHTVLHPLNNVPLLLLRCCYPPLAPQQAPSATTSETTWLRSTLTSRTCCCR
jgi:hypothetical protein